MANFQDSTIVDFGGTVNTVRIEGDATQDNYSFGDTGTGGVTSAYGSNNIAIGASALATTVSAGTTLANVQITSVNGDFSCNASTFNLFEPIIVSGTLSGSGTISGYVNPTMYYIVATNNTTTFRLGLTPIYNVGITTTAGTTTGLTFTRPYKLHNTGIGASALTALLGNSANGPSNNNVAIGTNVGKKLKYANDNVIIGSNSIVNYVATNLAAKLQYNVIVGSNAVSSATTFGLYNTFIGNAAGATTPTIGGNNTIVGERAASAVASIGGGNIGIGGGALSSTSGLVTLVVGDNNTAVGNYSGSELGSSGSYNAFVGALSGTIAGSYNVCIGAYSGGTSSVGAVTGSYNTMLGFHSGTALTSGTGNIVIGNMASPSLDYGPSGSASNDIWILTNAATTGIKYVNSTTTMSLLATKVVVNHTASITIAGNIPSLQSHGTTGIRFSTSRWTADVNPPIHATFKSRGASVGTRATVNNGDNIFQELHYADDGTNDVVVAAITVYTDGTIAANQVPGHYRIAVADTVGSVITRFDISSLGVNTFTLTGAGKLFVTGSTTDLQPVDFNMTCSQPAGSGYGVAIGPIVTPTGAITSFYSNLTIPSFRSGQTFASAYCAYLRPDSTAAQTGVVTSLIGLQIQYTSGGWLGQAPTDYYHINLANPTASFTGNCYNIYTNCNSATNKWNIYAAGTANNYIAGTLFLNSTDNTLGNVISGTASQKVTFNAGSANSGYTFWQWNSGTTASQGIEFCRSLSGTIGSLAQPAATTLINTLMGSIWWSAADGTAGTAVMKTVGEIVCLAPATAVSGFCPGRIEMRVASTTATRTELFSVDGETRRVYVDQVDLYPLMYSRRLLME